MLKKLPRGRHGCRRHSVQHPHTDDHAASAI